MTVREAAHIYVEHIKRRMERGERFSRTYFVVVEGQLWNYIAPDAARREKMGKKMRASCPSQKASAP